MTHGQTSGSQALQRGAALVVSLILLLIMTIVGISAMNGARLEVNMAGMMQREEVALRAAERTLAAAELYTRTAISNNFNANAPGHYLAEDDLNVAKTDWTGIESLNTETLSAQPALLEQLDLGNQDAFVVEFEGTVSLPGSALNDGGDPALPGEKANVYRITTRSETAGNAVRIVESIYAKLYNPMTP